MKPHQTTFSRVLRCYEWSNCQSCFPSLVFQPCCGRNLPLVSAEEEELANYAGVHRTLLMESVLGKRLQAFSS